jgi:hypothetical protein
MIVLPISTTNHERDAVVVVLSPENILRCLVGDPVSICLKDVPAALHNPEILIAVEHTYEEVMKRLPDVPALSGDENFRAASVDGSKVADVIKYLTRGWKETGDDESGSCFAPGASAR